jgi:hypothetical protein
MEEQEKELRESPAGNSQVKLYQVCPRQWAWKYLKGFKGNDKSEPLNLGSAIHEGQEVYYKTGDLGLAIDRGTEILTDAGWLPNEDIFHRMIESINVWVETYGADDLKNKAVLETEQQYDLKLPNGYIMTIRVDSLMRDHDGSRFIRDTKTTKGSPVKTMTQYMYEAQPILYIAALKQAGKEVSGWKTDVISSRMLKAGVKVECLRSDLICPSPDLIQDTLESYADLTDMIKGSLTLTKEGATIRQAFPRNCQSCYNYYRECSYWSACSSIDDVLEPINGTELDPWLKEGKVLNTYK